MDQLPPDDLSAPPSRAPRLSPLEPSTVEDIALDSPREETDAPPPRPLHPEIEEVGRPDFPGLTPLGYQMMSNDADRLLYGAWAVKYLHSLSGAKAKTSSKKPSPLVNVALALLLLATGFAGGLIMAPKEVVKKVVEVAPQAAPVVAEPVQTPVQQTTASTSIDPAELASKISPLIKGPALTSQDLETIGNSTARILAAKFQSGEIKMPPSTPSMKKAVETESEALPSHLSADDLERIVVEIKKAIPPRDDEKLGESVAKSAISLLLNGVESGEGVLAFSADLPDSNGDKHASLWFLKPRTAGKK